MFHVYDKFHHLMQIGMLHDDITRVQLELIPMIQEIVFEWLIILFFGTTPSESPSTEDFSSQLSTLQIGKFFLPFEYGS